MTASADNCITAIKGAGGSLVDSLTFVFKDGTEEKVGGDGGAPGDPGDFGGGCLAGVYGGAGGSLDGIGFYH